MVLLVTIGEQRHARVPGASSPNAAEFGHATDYGSVYFAGAAATGFTVPQVGMAVP
jgi:hypothetical protein